ncbi:MAG: nuclear transport factor 2 family protein [Anaerolineales bacterium]
MSLTGKGFFTWKLRNVERGNAEAIAEKAARAGLTHLIIKIADGNQRFGEATQNRAVVNALRNRRIQVWGWHYVYGSDPNGEARVGVEQTKTLRLDGYVIDAEHQYKQPGKDAAARQYMAGLRQGLPSTPIALSSYRYPSFHRELPWAAFLEKCDYNMPQVYWEKAHNPDAQLKRTVQEFANTRLVGFNRPVIPTGSAYGSGDWVATANDLRIFLQQAVELGLKAANAYSWDWATLPQHHSLFDAVANFAWPGPVSELPDDTPPADAPIEDILQRYVDALNNRDLDALIGLYQPNAGHVTARHTVIGTQAIRDWYERLLDDDLPGGAFNVGNPHGQGASWTFQWTANSPAGQILDGADTLGLRNGLIQYHYMSYTIT